MSATIAEFYKQHVLAFFLYYHIITDGDLPRHKVRDIDEILLKRHKSSIQPTPTNQPTKTQGKGGYEGVEETLTAIGLVSKRNP